MIFHLSDFRRLSAPPADAIAKRDEQIEKLKQQLRFKYLLSKSLPRVK